MRTIKSLTVVACLILATLVSCEKFIDEPQPIDTVSIDEIGNSTSGLETALTGAWAWWTAPQSYVGNAMIYPEAMADYANNTFARQQRADAEAYRRDFETSGYGLIGEFGQRVSRAENLANQVILSARDNQPQDEGFASNKDRLLGEGLFLRSWIHFEYAKMSGIQWNTKNPGENIDALGPMIRFKPVLSLEDLAQARTPVAAAYDSIISGLKQAEMLLPEFYDAGKHDASFQVRASRDAASTLLAKVYWQQNDFDNALIHINKAIGSIPGQSDYPLANDFTQVYNRTGTTGTTNTADKSEVILEYVAAAPSKISTRNGQALSNTWWRDGRTNLYFTEYFQNLAQFDTINDRRYLELINPNFTQSRGNVTDEDNAWSTLKFFNESNVAIFRSAELLLMRAEIFARRGQTTDALADLNYIRSRAGITSLTNSTNLIEEILTERIREMHAEGYRVHDLRRLGSLTDGEPNEVFILPGARDLSDAQDCGYPGACVPIKWNDLILIWRLPQSEIDINPLATNP